MSLVGFKAQNHGQQVGARGALDKVDDRRTPRSLWDPLNAEFRFTLDVAASAENTLCPRFFTAENDGLRPWWDGSVWCNPPYSDCGAWVRKAIYESQWVSTIVMLLPANRTEQKWWQELVESVSPGPYLEMFARRNRLGWDTWGDEALQHVEIGAA